MATFTAIYSVIAVLTFIYIEGVDGTFAQVTSTKKGDKALTAFMLSLFFPLYFGIKVYSFFFPES